LKDQTEVAGIATSEIEQSVSLQKKAADNTEWLGERNLAKKRVVLKALVQRVNNFLSNEHRDS